MQFNGITLNLAIRKSKRVFKQEKQTAGNLIVDQELSAFEQPGPDKVWINTTAPFENIPCLLCSEVQDSTNSCFFHCCQSFWRKPPTHSSLVQQVQDVTYMCPVQAVSIHFVFHDPLVVVPITTDSSKNTFFITFFEVQGLSIIERCNSSKLQKKVIICVSS